MKTFLFETTYLLSRKEKKAREINFHSQKNLLVGKNHTGKSSLVKNMFLTLGARPEGKLENWDIDAICVVVFSMNGVRYKAVHQMGNRALFSSDNSLVVATSNFREWSDLFAKTVDFNLVLTDKKAESVLADPRCFFLPFYINQDGSWQASWNTFIGLQQYKAPSGGILEYFTGIKPPKYYEINSQKNQLQKSLEEAQKEQKLIHRARERFNDKISLSGPKVQAGNFEVEIELLTAEVNSLNKKQELLRDTAVREQELLHSISVQIELANETLAIYNKDSSYLQRGEQHRLECPTCGAQHTKSFLDILTYADDARSLRELVVKLSADAKEIHENYSDTQGKLGELESSYQKVSDILNTRQGDLKFADVVNSMGAESAFTVFEDESVLIKSAIDEYVVDIALLNEDLKTLTDRDRSKKILSSFRDAYRSALQGLNLPLIETDKLKLTSRPNLSGSSGPRSVLAYYAALWTVCRGTYADFSIPLVIDSPNQQGQDGVNLPLILSFISEKLPENSQIILGSEIDTVNDFDNKIELNIPYGLLLENEFENVSDIVNPLVDSMFASLQSAKYV